MFSSDIVQPAHTLVHRLSRAPHTLSVAESCTGGLIGAAITSVAGASAVFVGGVIAYANDIKQRILGVPTEVLATNGAVSAPTVRAMAAGVATLTGSDYALAVSGVAGPGGGSREKPVGLVYIGLHSPAQTTAFAYRFDGDREAVRRQAVAAALSRGVEAIH